MARAGVSIVMPLAAVGCAEGTAAPRPDPTPSGGPPMTPPIYQDAPPSPPARVEDLLARMTLEEKIGQMTQVEKNSLTPADVTTYFLGSVLSGGGGHPTDNTPQSWAGMVDGFQQAALQTRLAIPILYGVDAVHGHAGVRGATVFPHNIGLGAANDPELMRQIGRATAEEMLATGIPWNFGPAVSVPQDIRWGRTYEGYSENTELVTRLAIPYLEGMQTPPAGADDRSLYVLGTPKHFVGDGGTTFGSPTTPADQPFLLDQGDTQVDEATLRALFLAPYASAVEAGAMSVMASFNSWNGTRMHAHRYLLTDVLKAELGFPGFVVSDWQAIDQISPDYAAAVVTSINAGVDMVMTPYDHRTFIATLTEAVGRGDVPQDRIDDAVRRILTAKVMLGLFEHPYHDPALLETFGGPSHRQLARRAVRSSLVLLKNENHALPIRRETPLLFVAGEGADDIGIQCGGWTIEWQGRAGDITPGTTILQGIRAAVSPAAELHYNRFGRFDSVVDSAGEPRMADVGLVVVGETPYAEGLGDRADLGRSEQDRGTLVRMRQRSRKLVVLVISGRPLILTDQLPSAEAVVAAWLPGTEGAGVADVLFGDNPFTGKLPYTWPQTNDPGALHRLPAAEYEPLFPFGFGLGS